MTMNIIIRLLLSLFELVSFPRLPPTSNFILMVSWNV